MAPKAVVMEAATPVSRLVVIGASAGGVEALNQLVGTLPVPFPAPVVIAQHLDPSHVSHLAEIFGHSSSLQVRTVTESVPLENGFIYVVPSNRDVEISDHHVRLREGNVRPKPSVDLLFGSAASAFGEDLIAVILTGTGSDGADGAQVVKEHGGLVVVQNPATASFPGMPLSLAPTVVDIVAELSTIGPLLYDLLTGSYTLSSPGENQEMRALLERLRERSGIDFSRYRQSTIQRRLQRRMADVGAAGITSYQRYVEHHPEEYQRLATSFLINVTSFFRDVELFDRLRSSVLPEMVQQARDRGGELRVWCAGCATGEEAYSLGILLADFLGELADFKIRIFATDLSAEAIAFARRGIYPATSLRDVPPALLETYFSPLDGAFEVKKVIRALLVFGEHDLGQRAPFPRTDLVLCRNVLIYFSPELQRRALQLFAFSLQNRGWLVLGKSETTNALPDYFAVEDARLRIYRRREEGILIPPYAFTTPQQTIQARVAQLRQERNLAQESQAAHPALRASEQDEATLRDLPTGVVRINHQYDILAINLAARRLLGIHGTALGEDLVHLTDAVPTGRLRALIDAAAHGETVHEILVGRAPGGGFEPQRALEVHCYPHIPDESGEPSEAVIVTIIDVSNLLDDHERRAAALRDEQRRLTTELALRQEDLTRAAEALGESKRTLADLLRANQQLSRSNSILQRENEEILVGTAEAQSAAEEIETLNEEQQATNEELETLNEELQATIEELRTTNEDLNARTIELQDLAATEEAGHLRLAAVLASIADAVFTVNRAGRVMLTNIAFDRLFDGDGAGLLTEDEGGNPLPSEATPQLRASRGEQFTMHFTTKDAAGNRHWFEAVGQSVRGSATETGIVTVRDITERNLRRLQNQFIAMAAHELRTPLTVLQGSLEILERRMDAFSSEQRHEYLRMASREAHRLSALTEELVDIERLELGELRLVRDPMDLAVAVASAVNTSQMLGDGVPIVLAPFSDPLPINGDRMRLEQVLLNLLNNALKHAHGTDHVDVRLQRLNHDAQVEVQDYGPGIPAEDLPHIFSAFYRGGGEPSAGAGLGLGLFICREFVVAQGGSIDVRSEPGNGATFTIRLPLSAD
jgi:two-component system, chemotaxis family, CheB/CheR fusion protein